MKIKVNGIDIHYEITGDGPWLTLSHSVSCNFHMWDPQMDVLSKHFKVLRYDTRGHGQTSAPDGEYSLDQLADDAKGLLDALGIKKTHWMGLSMGGMIGQTLALKYPGIFQSMVLADTTSRRPPDADKIWGERIQIAQEQGMEGLLEFTLGRWFTPPYRKTHKDVIAWISRDICNTPAQGFIGCSHALSKIDLTDRLKEIDCPTLVIVGEQDIGTPVEAAREIHLNLPGSELKIIRSAAHLSNIEQAEEFNRLALDFLKDVATQDA